MTGHYIQGEIEFRSLLFIPGMAPFNTEDMLGAKTKNIRLYVKRVFISDEFDGELVSLCTFSQGVYLSFGSLLRAAFLLGSELIGSFSLCSSHDIWDLLKEWWTQMTFL